MSDLPAGYRWCTEEETEAYGMDPESVPGVIVVKRTADSNGVPYTQDEADLAVPYNWRTTDYRIIRGSGGNYKVQHYRTKEARDERAQHFANEDGSTVIAELWDPTHPQDDINQGWACDAAFEPKKEED